MIKIPSCKLWSSSSKFKLSSDFVKMMQWEPKIAFLTNSQAPQILWSFEHSNEQEFREYLAKIVILELSKPRYGQLTGLKPHKKE